MSADDFGIDLSVDEVEARIVATLPQRLRERACPAGTPWTGDQTVEDHGHTDCWFNHLAAREIERLRALLRDVAGSTVILAPVAPGEMPWCLVQVEVDTWAALEEFRQ